MRKITEIYETYKIMPHLQLHQLRVAAVARQIIDSIDHSVDADAIISACLLHDMGNVIKFKLEQTKEIFGFSQDEVDEIAHIQKEFVDRYGSDEHGATIQIAKEIGVSAHVIALLSGVKFRNLCVDRDGTNWEAKIVHYADTRVGPWGIISYDDRMDDAGKRYKDHPVESVVEKKRIELVGCGKEIEKQLFSSAKIRPENITDESSEKIIDSLKEFSFQ